MHLFFFVMPGILLIFSKAFNKKPLTEFLVYAVGLSISFFVVLPWFVKYLNVPLMFSAYLVFISAAIIMVINIKRIDMKLLNIDRNEMILIGIFLLVLFLRCLPVFFQVAPAGADMSMHSYIAQLIYNNDGILKSYEHLLPISNFGAYPAGFPTLSALISLMRDCPVYRSSLLMSCLTHALICFGLFVLLLRFFDRNTAAATSIAATFLTRSPQWVIRWGGNPTVLALFFFAVAFSLIIELKDGFSWLKVIFASLALAAVLITYPTVFYIGGLVLSVYFLMSLKNYRNICGTASMLFLFTLILLMPYLANLKFTLTRSAIEGARVWQMIDAKSVMYDLAAGIPLLILSAFGLPVLFRKSRELAVVFLAITAVLLLLILNYRFWVMPFSYLLYPGRTALALILPLAVFAAPAISKIISLQKKTLLIALVIIGSFYYCAFYLYNSIAMCPVAQADIDAFNWIDKTVSRKAVFENNYGDAGLWIPAIIGRAITDPHGEPIHFEGLKAGLSELKADYIYIGSKAVYNITDKAEDLEKKPWKYKRVFSNGSAQVWKIL
ncbi:MAG: hypothetical protein ABH860_04790 [bacterium]